MIHHLSWIGSLLFPTLPRCLEISCNPHSYSNTYSSDSKPVIESLFFDKIYNLLLQTDDQETKIKSLEILTNLIHSEE